MRFPLLVAGAFACLAVPASAAECDAVFEDIIAKLTEGGAPIAMIPTDDLQDIANGAESLLGKDIGEATRGFFTEVRGQTLLGLEVDGCLLDPIHLGFSGTGA